MTRNKNLRNVPHKATPSVYAKDAWWYEDRGGISVYINHSPERGVAYCTIRARHLIGYLERAGYKVMKGLPDKC